MLLSKETYSTWPVRQATISAITQSQLCHNLFFFKLLQKNLKAYSKSQIDNVYLIDAYR